jgi:hypothetical protein
MPEKRKPSAAELAARSRGMTGNAKLAEQFAVNDDYVRETVTVASLPDPPGVEITSDGPRGKQQVETVNLDEAVMNILRDEAGEIAERLGKFGIAFSPAMQQAVVDNAYSLIALNGQGIMTGGGALARR